MPTLVDVNFLIALLHARHVHSPRAVAWLAGQATPGSVAICRVVQMGTLRVLTNPRAMQEDVLSPSEFWAGWDLLRGDNRFDIVPEPLSIESVWRRLTLELPANQVADTDLYLAAFAIAGNYAFASFDRGFARFRGLRLVI